MSPYTWRSKFGDTVVTDKGLQTASEAEKDRQSAAAAAAAGGGGAVAVNDGGGEEGAPAAPTPSTTTTTTTTTAAPSQDEQTSKKKKRTKKITKSKNKKKKSSSLRYRLRGALIHQGIAGGGHYYSFVQDRESGKWMKFDDDRVTSFDPKNIPEVCFLSPTSQLSSPLPPHNCLHANLSSQRRSALAASSPARLVPARAQ